MSLEELGWDEARQAQFLQFAQQGLLPGRIVSEHRSHVQVATVAGEIPAEIPGRLWHELEVRSDMPGVGDFVALSPGDGQSPAVVEALLPRTSALIRQAAGERRPQLIAANVDIVMIVTGLDGDFSAKRIERYLMLVREGGADPVIVLNKADVGVGLESAEAELDRIAPNVPRHIISAHRREDLAVLERYFNGGRTIALVGSSGVGKSTLTNQFLGRDAQATQTVSAHDNRGRHTTTHRELFKRPGGGAVMDTPGMGGLQLWQTDDEPEPEDDFADIDALAAQCKFRNCAHESEPKCAVRAAMASGELCAERLEKYRAEIG